MLDPFKNIGEWKQNLDQFFGDNFWKEFEGVFKPPIPQINLYQYDNELLCLVNIPGLDDINKVDVFVDYATLELKGTIELDQYGGQALKEEVLQGVFERKLTLPFPVRNDKVQATYQNGLLVIQLHRLIASENNKNRLEIRNLDEE